MPINPATIGIGVLSGAATLGIYICLGRTNEVYNEEYEIIAGKEPILWYILSDDAVYKGSNKPYKDKYGSKYHRHFVGVDKKVITNDDKTTREILADGGWKWSYKENYHQDAEGGFARSIVNSGQDLRGACEKAFKGEFNTNTEEIKESGVSYKISDIWKFCSPVGQIPVTITPEEEYEPGTIGAANKDKLASIKGNNKRYGEIKRNVFFYLDKENVLKDRGHLFFKKLYNKLDDNKKDIYSFRKVCEEAYSKKLSDKSTAESPSTAEVLKYCSLEEEPIS